LLLLDKAIDKMHQVICAASSDMRLRKPNTRYAIQPGRLPVASGTTEAHAGVAVRPDGHG
jgi:hypothetical protein